MFDNSPDEQANAAHQNVVAPKEQEHTADRRWLQDALEDCEVREALKLLRAREKAKIDPVEANRS